MMYSGQMQDTIAAPATGSSPAALAVIRLSGRETFPVIGKLFRNKKGQSKNFLQVPSHSVHYGYIMNEDSVVDDVLVTVFRNPRSYTGEDVAEISCHGSPFIVRKIMNLLTTHGIRTAQPGEFTLRAFLNRKMDLAQSEAVADLIAAESEASLKLAMQQLRGGVSSEIKILRQQLIEFASLIELELDFSEEDVEFASRHRLRELITELDAALIKLINSFETGNALRDGIPVVIAGKPNAGKSTLLNALVHDERAIVSEIPGTTRDVIEDSMVLGGIRFRFMDTAGIRSTLDKIESIGVSKTLEMIRRSRVILYLFDIHTASPDAVTRELESLRMESSESNPLIIPVANKCDLVSTERLHSFSSIDQMIFISAKEKNNLNQLEDALVSVFQMGDAREANVMISNVRHFDALVMTREALKDVQRGIDRHVTNDFLALDLRHALHHLSQITGEITSDDLLENIFSKFCIGK